LSTPRTSAASSVGAFKLFVTMNASTGKMSPAGELLVRSGVIQGVIADLNRAFVLPRDIPVRLKACGVANAFYSLRDRDITICDEWLAFQFSVFAGKGDKSEQGVIQAIISTTAFVFVHEVGHALIHQYGLKYTGQQEDVADQFAAYLMAGTETGRRRLLVTADAFRRMSALSKPITWDNHALDEQRHYRILCWIYGSDQARYQSLVDSGQLPEALAPTCGRDFADLVAGIDERVRPHLRK
jgi:hypothetical protein